MSNLQYLEELLRKAQDLIHPVDHEDYVNSLSQDKMKQLQKDKPNCFLTMDDVLFPLCSTGMRRCPKMIRFSLKYAQTLVGKEGLDNDKLAAVIQKLEKLKARYDKEVPTPPSASARKAHATKRFNKNMG